MKSETVSVQELFRDRRQYRVPFYQRAYVWNKGDQWEGLWQDVLEKAEARLEGLDTNAHFLGALVLEPQKKDSVRGVETFHIIDGQQRLTTLQYLLKSLAIVARAESGEAYVPVLEQCLSNDHPETMNDPTIERFKVWPTFKDRPSYTTAMDVPGLNGYAAKFPESFTQHGSLRVYGPHPPALEAIWYFAEQIERYAEAGGKDARGDRLAALCEALLRDIRVVSISLGEEDDAQVIFETLNGRGAELHATDLIRNFIFLRADRESADAGQLYGSYWQQFEDSFWSAPLRRGRLAKPRLEWFVQAVLQSRLREDVDIGRLYVEYRRLVLGSKPAITSTQQLEFLHENARAYVSLIECESKSAIGRYGAAVAAWEGGTTHPLALAIARTDLTESDRDEMFGDVVSYLVRRAICGLTPKNYNKLFVQFLKAIGNEPLTPGALRKVLIAHTGDSSRWPDDDEFQGNWLKAKTYPGRLNAAQVRSVLAAIETGMRSARSEDPYAGPLETLDVDHIMPTSWFDHWSLSDGSTATAAEASTLGLKDLLDEPMSDREREISARQDAKCTWGNLTLAHLGTNRSVQHYAFGVKREAFFLTSNLHLNRELMRLETWDERAIGERSRALFEIARRLWPGPR